jgi:hypothetical protein
VLTAFDRGLKEIKNQTYVETIFGYKYEFKEMVLEGDSFNPSEKLEIKRVMLKYKDHFPEKALWGYDNCQLLIAFETNIPNNTLPIFWSEKNWSPLIKRK